MSGIALGRRLARLPREARDTFFLLATIAATVLPHVGHLPAWCSALTALMLLWRAHLAWRAAPLPGRWLLLLLLGLSVGLTLLTHRSLMGREAGITLLALLMALKTLELRARRDAFVVFFLGFFLVLTHFLYSQSLLTALWTLATVWALLSALVLAQMPVGQPSLRLAAVQAARLTLLGLPLMLALFMLFPRIAPLWGVPSDAVGRTGLSQELAFGAMAEIANDESIAMRLRFEGAAPPSQALYFRGPVLSRFDGRSWRALGGRPDFDRPPRAAAPDAGPRVRGQVLRYQVTVEPLRLPLLPLLESGPEPPGSRMQIDGLRLQRAGDLSWLAERTITERLRLNAEAYLEHDSGPRRPTPALQAELQLPAGLNPRTLQWAAALRRDPALAGLPDEARGPALVDAVLAHLRDGGYFYTLAPGRYGEASPHLIDEFWFDRRLGFCEHFASAFVVVMRALGVPARIVTGFQGADPELQDGYVVVRNAQAHAWAEVWLAGRGWQRVDPTAAVAPERISLSRTLRAEPGGLAGALGQVSPTLWRGLRRAWEQLDNRWQQHVLNYSRGDQFELLRGLGWSSPDWQALGQLSALLIALLALAGVLRAAWQGRAHDGWSRLRAPLLRELARLDVAALPHQSPRRWAELLRSRHGAAAAQAVELLLELERLRYGRDAPARLERATRRRWLAAFRRAGRRMTAATHAPN